MGDNAGASKAQADLSSLTLKKIGPFWVLIFGQVKTKLPSPINVQQELSLKVENNAAFIWIDNEIKYEVIVNDVGNISLKSVVEDTPLSPQNDVNPQVEAEQPDPIAQSVSDVDNKAQHRPSNEPTAAIGNQHEKQPSDDLSKSELSNLQNKDQPLNKSDDDTQHGENDEEEPNDTPEQKNEITVVGTIDDEIGNVSLVLGKENLRANTESTIETEINQCPEGDTHNRVTDQESNVHEDVSDISEINAIPCKVEGTTDESVYDAKARTDSHTNDIEEQQLSNGNIEENPTESCCEEKPDDSLGKITDPEDIKLTDGSNVADCANDESTSAGELNAEHSQLETRAKALTERDTSSLTKNIHKSATKSEYKDESLLLQEWDIVDTKELGPDKVNSQADDTSESASPSATSEGNTDVSKETPAEKHMSTETDAEHEHTHGNPVHVKGAAEADPCLTIHNTKKERDTDNVELSEDGNGIPCETNQEASVIKDSSQQTQTHMESLSSNVVANYGQLPDRAGSPDVSPKLEYGGNTNVTSGASMTKDKTIETTDTPDVNDAETRQNHETQDEANETVDKPGENEEDIRQNHHSKNDANETTDTPDANEAEPRQNHQSQDDAIETTGTPDANEAESRQNHRSQDDANETAGTPDANKAEPQQNHRSQDDANETTGTPDANKAEPRQSHHNQDNASGIRKKHQSQDEANETTDKPDENEEDTQQNHHNQDDDNETADTCDRNDAETRQSHHYQDDANETTDTPDEYDTETRQNHHSQDDINTTSGKIKKITSDTRSVNDERSQTTNQFITIGNNEETEEPNTELKKATAKEKGAQTNNGNANACYDLRGGNHRPTNNIIISDASSSANKTEYTPDAEQLLNTCESTVQKEHGNADTGTPSDNDLNKSRKKLKTAVTSKKHTKAADISTGSGQTDTSNHTQQISTSQTVVSLGPEVAPNGYQLQTQRNSTDENTPDKCETDEQLALGISTKDDDIDEEMDAHNAQHLTMKRKNDMETPKSKRQCDYNEPEYKTSGDNNINEKPRSRETSQSTGNNTFVEQTKRQLFHDKNTSTNSTQRQKPSVTHQLDHQTLETTDGRTEHVHAKSTYIRKGNLAAKEETHEDVQTKKTTKEGATIADDSGDEVQNKMEKQTKENDPVAGRTSTNTETTSNRNQDHTQTNNNAKALQPSRRAAQTNQPLYTEASGPQTQSATRQVTPRTSSNGQGVRCQQSADETDRRQIERHNSRETKTIEDHKEETMELEHIWESLFDHFEIQKSLQNRFAIQINRRVTKTNFKCVVSGKGKNVSDAIGAFRAEFMDKRVYKAINLEKVPIEVFSKTDILKRLNSQIKKCLLVLSESPEKYLLLYSFDKWHFQTDEDKIRRLVSNQRLDAAKLLVDREDLNQIANELSTKERGVLLIKDTNSFMITVFGLKEGVRHVVNEIVAKLKQCGTLPECERIATITVPVENQNAFAVIKSDNVFLDRLHTQCEVVISPVELHDIQGFELKGNREHVSKCETKITEYVGKVKGSIFECGDNRTEMYVRSKDGHAATDAVAKRRRVLIHRQTKFKRKDQNKDAARDRLGTDLLKVIVEEGSLDRKRADVLVNTTSKTLDLKNGAVSAALLKSAGDEIQKECSSKYPQGVQIGQIATTGGHNLNCKHVFHGSIPNYAGGQEEVKSRQNLRTFVNKCLQKAVMLKQVTIAFPAIGTGNLGYPVDVVADEMFSCVERFKQTCEQMSLEQVYFVIYPGDQRTIKAFKDMERRQTNICGGRNTRASNEALPSRAPETLILELQIFGYDTNVESAKSDIEKMLKHDLPKSQSTVYMSLPPEVSELLRQIDQTSGQCYRFKLQQELSDMDVALVDVDKVLEVRASVIDILKEAPRYISKFCYKHFNVSITLKEHYHMEEKTYSISSDQYSLFCFYSSDILSRCKKDEIRVFMTGNTLVIEGRLEKTAVAKTKIHQNIDTIENILFKESINIGNVLEVKNMHNVVDQFQNTTATVCCIFKPEIKSVEFYGHLKYEVEKTKLAFSEHLKEINDRRQHPGNLNVNIGTNINSTNAPLSPMTSYSNAVTKRPKNKDIFTCYTQEQLSVKVYEADIFSVNVDCIVNAANEDLKHVGGIAFVIASKAGQDLIKECDNYTKQNGPLHVGRALRTSAGKLHYKCVIHAVGPCWKDYKPITHESIQKCQKDLHDAVWYSLDIANRNHMTSVAIPAISTASFGVPRELCASEFAKSVMMFSKQRFGTRGHTLKEVCFVDTDPKTIQIIKETFSVMIKDQKPCPHSLMQYIVQKPTNSQHGQGSRAPEIPPRNRPHTNVETPNTFSYPLYIMSPNETQCKYTDRHTLRIYTGDILNVLDADTIVCGEDISGSAKGYIAKCLKDVGKQEYVKVKNDAFSNTKPQIGDVIITHGGKSQFKRIAHALVPHRRQFPSETEWKKSLRKMYDRIFGETSRAGSFSLILPLLGTGAANADLQIFIEIFLDSYVVACNRHQTNPLTVSIVNIEEHKTCAIVEVFKKHIDKHRNYTSTDVHTDPANGLTRSRTDRHSGSFTPRTGHENIDKYAKGASAARPPGGHGRNVAGAYNKQKFAERSRRVQINGCVICLDDKINNPKRLICGHTFCKKCIDRHFKVKPVCPTCSTVCGTITGDQPKGQMEISRSYLNLDGYDLKGSISITYIFPAGKQNSNHPRPGAQYTGLKRTAYLPDIEKGQKICAMLREAFNRKLVFTIGTSRTTGQDGVITWNDIHHKTDIRSNAQFGYPDPKYLARVTDELKAKGVTESDIDQNFLRRLKTLNNGQKLHNL